MIFQQKQKIQIKKMRKTAKKNNIWMFNYNDRWQPLRP